jgi:hypothetical protein
MPDDDFSDLQTKGWSSNFGKRRGVPPSVGARQIAKEALAWRGRELKSALAMFDGLPLPPKGSTLRELYDDIHDALERHRLEELEQRMSDLQGG